jgi:ligand-binding SRPBCC domain-containing protein
MPSIYLETIIQAPIDFVFDASRNIDIHQVTALQSNEKAIAGKVKGLLELNETLTWRAKHFGIYQNLTVKMLKLEKPYLFEDIMTKGAFTSMSHIHQFKEMEQGVTRMSDTFTYVSPFGVLGRIVDYLFLDEYMTNFLYQRNLILKEYCEQEFDKIHSWV